MADLLIKDAELKQLDQIVGSIPTVYGLPIVNFLNGLFQTRNAEAAAEAGKDEPKPTAKVVKAKGAN